MADERTSDIPQRIHDTAADLLNRRLAGELGIEAKIAAWTAADERHRLSFAEARLLWGDSGGLTQSALGADGKLARAPFYMRQGVQYAAATAAVLSFAAVGSVLLFERGFVPSLTTQARAATYRTALGEVRTFELGEGVALTLDTQSRVEVSQEGETRRIAVLEGRARLQDRTGAHRFVVGGGRDDIEIRGQGFDASRIAGGDESAVRIVAIAAPIQVAALKSGAGASTISAGSAAEFAGGEQRLARTADTRWPDGLLVLDDTPLGDAIQASNRYNRVKIRLGAQRARERTISGAFQVRQPETLAAALARLAGLRAERYGDLIVLTAPPR